MGSVGQSWAILKGRLSGDTEQADQFLSSLTPEERTLRNRAENRTRRRLRKKRRSLGSRGST